MIKAIYELLQSFGFMHPLHPSITHIPMGMVMGAFFFTLGARFLAKPELYKTAYYCSILALIGLPFTALFGIMDWQYMYGGAWSTPIIAKLILASVLLVLLLISAKFTQNGKSNPNRVLVIYFITLLVVIGLGFSGGELLFSE